ncbi:MAG: hypothetical protein ABSH00_17390 [Bryobacteraceae bacterium]
MRTLLHVCGLVLVLLGVASAEDLIFKKSKVTTAAGQRETPVDLIVSDHGVTVRGKSGTSVNTELPYSAIGKISYAFIDQRRLELAPLLGLSAAFTRRLSHWLVIESGTPVALRSTVLRLDKTEYREIISALNSRSGKRVEVLEPHNTVLDPTAGSHDEDETVPFRIDAVFAALKPAMESVGCKVGRSTSGHVECKRGPHLKGPLRPGGELITATLEAKGVETRVQIRTSRGMGHDWSSPVYRELRKRLGSPGA